MASETPSVDVIAAEAEDARERIASTLDELQDALNPRKIVGDAVNNIQTKVGDGSQQLLGRARDVAREHPLALGAAVAAVGLALLARNRIGHATLDLGDDLDGYTDYDDGYGTTDTPQLYDDEAFEDDDGGVPAPSLADRASALTARASAQAGALGQRATGTVADNPLLSILAGLAAGAALGLLLPATDAERRAFGETSGRVGRAARAAMRQAGDELKAVGLDPQGLKSTVGNVKDRARATARSVADAARSEMKG